MCCRSVEQDLSESLKRQLAQRDGKLAEVNAALVAAQLEQEETANRLSHKDRELGKTKHAFRMHIRKLEVGRQETLGTCKAL